MPDTSGPIELRGSAPRPLIDVLDAVSSHRRMTRSPIAAVSAQDGAGVCAAPHLPEAA